MSDLDYPDALPPQYRLHWYVLERVLGQGGFGITYLARDTNLEQMVAIKEYLPGEVASRRPDHTVRCRTETQRDRYRWGLERFIREARTLARFDHPNIVRVHSVFELNDTAYMVMRFEAGDNLGARLEQRGILREDELLRILLPILDGLELVHNAGFIHRDIKPDNIHIRDDGTPVLLDFGSARHALGRARTLTILIAPGYAPFEQYYSSSENQGPWTDIYGLGATCYRAIAGTPPLDSITRSKGILGSTREMLVPASVIGKGRYSDRLLAAIDHALEFTEKDRPQSIAEWRSEIVGQSHAASANLCSPPVAAPAAVPPAPASTPAAADHAGASAVATVRAPVTAPTSTATPAVVQRSDARIRMAWGIAGASAAAIATVAFLTLPERASEQKIAEARHQLAQERDKLDQERKASEERRRLEEQERVRLIEQKSTEQARIEQEQRSKQQLLPPPPKSPVNPPKKTPPDEQPRGRTESPPTSISHDAAPPTVVIKPTPAEPVAPPTPAERLASADRAEARGDYAAAVEIFKSLADADHARAQARLGDMYAAGRGVTQDNAMAATWYRKAAEQGDSLGLLGLGHIYAGGRGVTRNYNQAYIWYTLAMRAGNNSAEAYRIKVAAELQPAEIRQADTVVERMRAQSAATR